MGNPNESHDDYVAKRAPENASNLSGHADVPDTLLDIEVPEPVNTSTFLLWVHRIVAVGSILALIVIIFVGALSAILFLAGQPNGERSAAKNGRSTAELKASTNGAQPDEADLLANGEPADEPTEEEPLGFDIFSEPASVPTPRSNVRRKRVRPRSYVAAYRRRRPIRPVRRPLVQLFTPTTLVIYVENGKIKTRTEPWVQTSPTPNN